MINHRAVAQTFVTVVLTVVALTAEAAEIRVLSTNASALAQRDMAADFTRQTGHMVSFTVGSPGPVQQRFAAGETFDLLVMATDLIDALEKSGKFLPGSRRALARVAIGLAAREGAPRPDLSTLESTRKALLDARSISYSEPGTGGMSGVYAQQVLANLGIADAVKAKLRPRLNVTGQELIAKGEIEFGLYNVSEIPRAKGVVRVGPLPAAVQVYTSYDIAVPATNVAPEPALAFRDYLLNPAQRARWEAAGLEMAQDWIRR
jgi:molybdate transport system substrate-binding protein